VLPYCLDIKLAGLALAERDDFWRGYLWTSYC
jgi:hypothetical protein